MTPLIIDKKKQTIGVILDKTTKTFKFEGTSIPENNIEFFKPIYSWIENYIKDPNEETVIHFMFDYFNTASTKDIYEIMVLFKELSRKKMVLINWYFHEADEDMFEAGEEYQKILNIKFNLIKR